MRKAEVKWEDWRDETDMAMVAEAENATWHWIRDGRLKAPFSQGWALNAIIRNEKLNMLPTMILTAQVTWDSYATIPEAFEMVATSILGVRTLLHTQLIVESLWLDKTDEVKRVASRFGKPNRAWLELAWEEMKGESPGDRVWKMLGPTKWEILVPTVLMFLVICILVLLGAA